MHTINYVKAAIFQSWLGSTALLLHQKNNNTKTTIKQVIKKILSKKKHTKNKILKQYFYKKIKKT